MYHGELARREIVARHERLCRQAAQERLARLVRTRRTSLTLLRRVGVVARIIVSWRAPAEAPALPE
jgi:hypothetical protein